MYTFCAFVLPFKLNFHQFEQIFVAAEHLRKLLHGKKPLCKKFQMHQKSFVSHAIFIQLSAEAGVRKGGAAFYKLSYVSYLRHFRAHARVYDVHCGEARFVRRELHAHLPFHLVYAPPAKLQLFREIIAYSLHQRVFKLDALLFALYREIYVV